MYLSYSGYGLFTYPFSPDPIPLTLDPTDCNHVAYQSGDFLVGFSLEKTYQVRVELNCLGGGAILLTFTSVTEPAPCDVVHVNGSFTIDCDTGIITSNIVDADPNGCLGAGGGGTYTVTYVLSP